MPRPLTLPCVPFGTRRFPSLCLDIKVIIKKERVDCFLQKYFLNGKLQNRAITVTGDPGLAYFGKWGRMMNRLVLHIPTQNELECRRHLISDEKTMAYNHGYGDDESGCYYQTIEQV